jgi:hypothetical protein
MFRDPIVEKLTYKAFKFHCFFQYPSLDVQKENPPIAGRKLKGFLHSGFLYISVQYTGRAIKTRSFYADISIMSYGCENHHRLQIESPG